MFVGLETLILLLPLLGSQGRSSYPFRLFKQPLSPNGTFDRLEVLGDLLSGFGREKTINEILAIRPLAPKFGGIRDTIIAPRIGGLGAKRLGLANDFGLLCLIGF